MVGLLIVILVGAIALNYYRQYKMYGWNGVKAVNVMFKSDVRRVNAGIVNPYHDPKTKNDYDYGIRAVKRAKWEETAVDEKERFAEVLEAKLLRNQFTHAELRAVLDARFGV